VKGDCRTLLMTTCMYFHIDLTKLAVRYISPLGEPSHSFGNTAACSTDHGGTLLELQVNDLGKKADSMGPPFSWEGAALLLAPVPSLIIDLFNILATRTPRLRADEEYSN
jgi:hypothetical protein